MVSDKPRPSLKGSRAVRSSLSLRAEELPRLRALYRAALSTGGNLRRMRETLGVSAQAVSQRLSLLRRLGVARTITLHDPLAMNGPCQSTAWVRMAPVNAVAIERFEEALRQDDAIVSAQRIVGDCDYRLSCFHQSAEAAVRWLNVMRCRTDIAEIRQMPMRHIFGNELPGMVIWDGGLRRVLNSV